MAGWFDEFAKRSARGKSPVAAVADESTGLSRRDVIARGALVAGAAWTAPMLMSTRAYAFGVSSCPTTQTCGPATVLQFCCEAPVTGTGATFQCTYDTATNSYGCAAPAAPGGICDGNNGSGTSSCKDGVFCNGNLSSNDCRCTSPNTCGGYGATCTQSLAKSCAPGYSCAGGFCRPSCDADSPCPSDLLNVNGTLVCTSTTGSGYCRQTCNPTAGGKSTCPNGQSCRADGFCA